MVKRTTIEQLEAALQDGDHVEIRPDGSIKRARRSRRQLTPLTFRKQLGGEYTHA